MNRYNICYLSYIDLISIYLSSWWIYFYSCVHLYSQQAADEVLSWISPFLAYSGFRLIWQGRACQLITALTDLNKEQKFPRFALAVSILYRTEWVFSRSCNFYVKLTTYLDFKKVNNHGYSLLPSQTCILSCSLCHSYHSLIKLQLLCLLGLSFS